MKATTFAYMLLAAATAAVAAPTNEQIVLGGDDTEDVYTVTSTTFITRTRTITKQLMPATSTPTAVPSVSPGLTLKKKPTGKPKKDIPALLIALDWLFHPESRSRKAKAERTGCFCGGGSVCCYGVTKELSCGYGACAF